MDSFITGSHVYGTPTEDSEIDLVVFVDEATRDKLVELSEQGKFPVRYGKLNLLIATTPEEYAVWKEGTAKLLELKEVIGSVNKEQASVLFDQLREKYEVQDIDYPKEVSLDMEGFDE